MGTGLAGHQVEIGFLQLLGHRAAASGADLPVIDFADRRDFGGGAGEEGLVGDVHLVAGDALLDHLDAQLVGQGQNGVAGDAVEAGGHFRGVDHAVLDQEDVLARALGHITLGIQQHGLVGAAGDGFLQGQHRVDVVAVGLGPGHRDVDVMAGEGAGAHLDADLQGFVAHVGAPVPGGDYHMHLQAGGAQSHGFRSVEHHRADVGAFQVVLAHRGAGRLVDLVFAERNLHGHDLGRVEQPVGVRLQAEDRRAVRGVVGAHAFEYAHAVVQGVGQHMGGRVTPRHQFAVIPNHAITIGHRHSCLLLKFVCYTRIWSPHAPSLGKIQFNPSACQMRSTLRLCSWNWSPRTTPGCFCKAWRWAAAR
ncbi:hypothetical protein D3C85_632660 [compost metagenome]